MNEKGWKLFDKWSGIYDAELKRLQEKDPDYFEGWCIIENERFVKTPEDVIGLYLFGYDEHIFDIIDEWKECNGCKGTDYVWDGIELTIDEFEKELEKYFK